MRRTATLARHLTTAPGATQQAPTRKVALVVGAGDALGSAVARTFALDGGYVRAPPRDPATSRLD